MVFYEKEYSFMVFSRDTKPGEDLPGQINSPVFMSVSVCLAQVVKKDGEDQSPTLGETLQRIEQRCETRIIPGP
jgi:hypothetical protein